VLFNVPGIVAGKNSAFSKVSFTLTGLFGKNMAEVLFLVFNLASPGKRIALGRALFGFHFWHFATLNYGLSAQL
jgi:hypothetical protein